MAALASRGQRTGGSDGPEELKVVEDTDSAVMLARIEDALKKCFEEWERNMNQAILWNDRALAAIMDA